MSVNTSLIKTSLPYLVCPDCHSSLQLAGTQVRCTSCRRRFYTEANFIDLLPARPSPLQHPISPTVADYYQRQFTISPTSPFKDSYAWGEDRFLSPGHQLFNHLEQKQIFSLFPTNRNLFVDLSAASGLFTFAASPQFKLVFHCDLNLQYLRFAQAQGAKQNLKNILYLRSDMFSLPFKNAVISTAVSTDTFIYYGNQADQAVVKHVIRLLETQGVFIFDLHFRKFYAPASAIYEYTARDVAHLQQQIPGLRVLPFGRLPAIISPNQRLFKIGNILRFLPPIRLICVYAANHR